MDKYVRTCRFLNREAIVEQGAGEESSGAWRLATVTEVGGDEAGGDDGAHLVTTLNFGMATLDRIQSSWAKTNWWKEAAELLG